MKQDQRKPVTALPSSFPAKGTSECTITNHTEIGVFGRKSGKRISWVINLYKNEHPGTTVYFLIGSKRLTTKSGAAPLSTAMLEALRDDPEIVANWTNWPYGHTAQAELILTNFADAFEKCQQFFANN